MQTPMELHVVQSRGSGTKWSDFCSDESFWTVFYEDLKSCTISLTILSPFVTNDATWKIANQLKDLKVKNVKITVYTRPAEEHQNRYGFNLAIARLEKLEVEVKRVSKIHKKLAVIDDLIWWEGSLNILGFRDSREQMRRFQCPGAQNVLKQLNLE